jgi:aspartate kinase
MIVQNVSEDGRTDVSFTVPKSDLAAAEPVLRELADSVGGHDVTTDTEVAKVSLVGAGMKTHPGVAADMFDALAEAGINIQIISTSTIRISCLVPAADVGRAVRAMHDRFRLAEPGIAEEAYGVG